ncbi:hypothetical protein PRIPAC_71610 [Pristionchus pacificus]|uniref:Uncharacterized protein n=1 Tax=Pristionchus pacificus TaxID=54126 RepID=A0A2A6CS42_PRIPA|nr:hypothetical protein PRIPAC_71610 [Pristionchus pacificus]|eukprot:PDM80940.1 hypothetical protein PRIPAC_35943 [Pristionchus pacificus]
MADTSSAASPSLCGVTETLRLIWQYAHSWLSMNLLFSAGKCSASTLVPKARLRLSSNERETPGARASSLQHPAPLRLRSGHWQCGSGQYSLEGSSRRVFRLSYVQFGDDGVYDMDKIGHILKRIYFDSVVWFDTPNGFLNMFLYRYAAPTEGRSGCDHQGRSERVERPTFDSGFLDRVSEVVTRVRLQCYTDPSTVGFPTYNFLARVSAEENQGGKGERLGELSKIHCHFGFSQLSDTEPCFIQWMDYKRT